QNDVIYGGSGNDTIKGNNGDDTLYGGSGNDIISGENGNDTIIGGYGADTLSGGGGNNHDTFVYLSVLDSHAGQADTITDFTSGFDKIDLTAFGATAFTHFRHLSSAPISIDKNTVAWYYDGTNIIVYGNPTSAPLSVGDSGLLQ